MIKVPKCGILMTHAFERELHCFVIATYGQKLNIINYIMSFMLQGLGIL
jgi:hypothetical protein